MTRLVASAAALGAVVALALYTATPLGWQEQLTARFGLSEGASDAVSVDAWPICTTMASFVNADEWAELDADFAAGKKALAAGQWAGAIDALRLASLRDPRNADIENYMGYAFRRLGQREPAVAHFQQAVAFNPRHRAAHQHLGESYLAIGDLASAEQHLAALDSICLIPCDEHADLQKAIASHKNAVSQ